MLKPAILPHHKRCGPVADGVTFTARRTYDGIELAVNRVALRGAGARTDDEYA